MDEQYPLTRIRFFCSSAGKPRIRTSCFRGRFKIVLEAVLAEIGRRFEKDVQIYEIQTVVEQELLKAHLYDLAELYIQYRTRRDFRRHQATDINFEIHKLLSKDQSVVNENANKDADVFNTQRDLTAGIVGKSIGLKLLPAHVANAHQKATSTTTTWITALIHQ